MSNIIQFSTIGALMSGFCKGELTFPASFSGANFGLGCSENINGELTIFEGQSYVASAGEDIRALDINERIPFIQVTNFQAQQTHVLQDINNHNVANNLSKFTKINNIFLAVSLNGNFEKMVIRCPIKATNKRTIEELHSSQLVSEYKNINGTLVGFWTPKIFGRVSVPGFHFHFIDDTKKISGHVLEFYASNTILSFEEKTGIEIINPANTHYKDVDINVDSLDDIVHRVEN